MMAATETSDYKKIKITGSMSVERVESLSTGFTWKILIMGPTGAGKSSFIETLGLPSHQKISSGQLEGFTQDVSTYKLNNIVDKDGDPIYIVDSPGFGDTKISEASIVAMLQRWLKANSDVFFNRILYLTPINNVRFPGSQRRILKTFQSLTGVESGKDISIVTTMWDQIYGERQKRQAETTLKQFEGEIWKEFVDKGAEVVRFHNTWESSLYILDEALSRSIRTGFNMEKISEGLKNTRFTEILYTNLQERVQSLRSERATLELDVAHAKEQKDKLLESILRARLEEVDKYLIRFQQELADIGPPPLPAAATPASPDLPLTSSSENPRTPDSPPPARDVLARSHNGAPHPKRGQFARALDVIIQCGCCGRAVEANHET